MSQDPFRHIASAKHFQNAARKELSVCKTERSKKIWKDSIKRYQDRIESLEQSEIEFWASFNEGNKL